MQHVHDYSNKEQIIQRAKNIYVIKEYLLHNVLF